MALARKKQNFRGLQKLLGDLEEFTAVPNSLQMKSEGKWESRFSDLHVKSHPELSNDKYQVISMAHYYKEDGNLVPDPAMTIRVYLQQEAVTPATYQDSLGEKQEVYVDGNKWRPELSRELCGFLSKWLSTLKKQGFYK